MRIELAQYDPHWERRFDRERRRLLDALGARALRIEHIGSTAVPGFAAKPIVDVLVFVKDVDDAAIDAALRSAAYEPCVTEPRHRMYRTPARDVHVHLWMDEQDVQRHLLFRDRLRSDADDRELYLHVKRLLAQRDWNEQNDYAQAKSGVVSAIVRRASGRVRGPRIEAFAEIIARYIPEQAAILEIGAGEGELAQRLCRAGHTVTAIDPQLRSLYPIVESSFEAYQAEGRSFDCIVAQLVLHHAADLDGMLDKMAALLAPAGIVAIDDFGWERSEDAGFRQERSDLHTAQAMLPALRERFGEVYYADHAYFEEGAGTDLLGFTFIGRLH